MASSSLVIKVQFGETLRLSIDDDMLSLNIVMLKEKICRLFNFSSDVVFTMTYVDEDGDEVILATDDDLRDVGRQSLDPLMITVNLSNGTPAESSVGTTSSAPVTSTSFELQFQQKQKQLEQQYQQQQIKKQLYRQQQQQLPPQPVQQPLQQQQEAVWQQESQQNGEKFRQQLQLQLQQQHFQQLQLQNHQAKVDDMKKENTPLLQEEENKVAREAEAAKKLAGDTQQAGSSQVCHPPPQVHCPTTPQVLAPCPNHYTQAFAPGHSENVGDDDDEEEEEDEEDEEDDEDEDEDDEEEDEDEDEDDDDDEDEDDDDDEDEDEDEDDEEDEDEDDYDDDEEDEWD